MRHQSSLEAFLMAVGDVVILIGVVGIALGVLSAPTIFAYKILIFLVGLIIAGIGALLIWLSTHIQEKREEREELLRDNPKLRFSVFGL